MGKFRDLNITSATALDVEVNFAHFFKELYNSASKMFVFNGFPEEVDIEYAIENLLLTGRVSYFQRGGKSYFLDAYLGGEEDVTYRPTKICVANPKIGSFQLVNNEDGVMFFLTPFDRIVTKIPSYTGGMYSLLSMTAILLADNISSINCAQVNSRVAAICGVENANDKAGVEETLKEIYGGRPFKVVKTSLMESFKVNPIANISASKNLIELIELHQYIKAQFWNALGIQFNSSMKREHLITAEVEANLDALKVPVQTMLESLNRSCEIVNNIYGLNTSITLNPEFELTQPENEEKGESKDVESEDKEDAESVDSDVS